MTDPLLLGLVHKESDLPPGHEVWEDYGFVIGLDLGKRQDYSAVALLRRYVRSAFVRDDSEVDPLTFELAVRRDHLTLEELLMVFGRVRMLLVGVPS